MIRWDYTESYTEGEKRTQKEPLQKSSYRSERDQE